jgi:pilus biogenesis lipoprotein CpaD
MMTRRAPFALLVFAAPLLAGCMPRPDYHDLPTSSVISVQVTASTEVPVANILAPTPADRDAVQRALAGVTEGVRVRLRLPADAKAAPDGEHLRKSLAYLGIPAGITAISPKPSEGAGSVLAVFHLAAVAPDCASMVTHSETINQNGRPSISFGCATYTNLAAMVADPADLESGRGLGPTDGSSMDAAIERYQNDKVKALSKNTATSAAPSTSN